MYKVTCFFTFRIINKYRCCILNNNRHHRLGFICSNALLIFTSASSFSSEEIHLLPVSFDALSARKQKLTDAWLSLQLGMISVDPSCLPHIPRRTFLISPSRVHHWYEKLNVKTVSFYFAVVKARRRIIETTSIRDDSAMVWLQHIQLCVYNFRGLVWIYKVRQKTNTKICRVLMRLFKLSLF